MQIKTTVITTGICVDKWAQQRLAGKQPPGSLCYIWESTSTQLFSKDLSAKAKYTFVL